MRVTWVKSAIGYGEDQKRTIRALGLRRLQQSVEHRDSPALQGMVRAVRHLVKVEPITVSAKSTRPDPAGKPSP
ncbi:MAG TPA: 50S ribosomal protein L30 [Candidatus Dormibacteraeota bacterium]